MGGMIGGAILGALVNKIQGKDVKRGLAWGALGGAGGEWATKAFGPGSGKFVNFLKKGSPGYKKLPWYNKLLSTLGTSMGEYSKYLPSVVGTGAGLGISQLMSDPEWEARKIRAEKERRLREQMARNRSFYPNWYRNPWTGNEMNPYGLNTGGMINARQGYPGGGSATLEYTDPDLYTPTGEGGGPSSSPILQIPLGPEGSFAEEFEDLDLASGPSGSDMSGWYEMYDDLKSKGELPDWMDSFELFMQNLDVLDISPTDFSARGGYKTRPGYAQAGPVDRELTERELIEQKLGMIYNHPKVKAGGERMLEEIEMMGLTQGDLETVNRKADYMLSQLNIDSDEITQSQRAEEMLTKSQRGDYLDMLQQVDPSNARFNPVNRAEDETYWEKIKEAAKRGWDRGPEGADKIKEYLKLNWDALQSDTDASNPRWVSRHDFIPSKEYYKRNWDAFLGKDWRDKLGPGHPVNRAEGGITDLDMTGGGASFGPGTGTSDDIPAMLSDGEFVVTAKAVENLGGGDRMEGARKMYSMMNQLDPSSQTPAEMSGVGYA